MKCFKMGFILFVLAIVLTGCAQGMRTNSSIADFSLDETMTETGFYEEAENCFKLSPTDINVLDLVTKIYSDEELSEIERFEGTIKELNELYPIECVRLTDSFTSKTYNESFKKIYRVAYLGEFKAVLFYVVADELYEKIGSSISYDMDLSVLDFEALSTDQTYFDVKKLDPNAYYPFAIYSIRLPHLSFHCTKEGFLITVEYDEEDDRIIGITKELI